jgi:hypothetical protein
MAPKCGTQSRLSVFISALAIALDPQAPFPRVPFRRKNNDESGPDATAPAFKAG